MSPKPTRRSGNGTDAAAHDVLAAEEFAMPAADPTIHRHPVFLPDDPTGIGEPHDVLAAEEFAMPAVRPHPAAPAPAARRATRQLLAIALLLLLLRRRRRRRRSRGVDA